MMYFFYLQADVIVKDLETALTNITKKEFKIRYINSKGEVLKGSILWNKMRYPFTFIINLGTQKTTVINNQQRIVMNIERKNSKDRIKPKDITDNPLSSIFKAKVQFVEHSDSVVQTQSKKLENNRYQVILYKFTDTSCVKDHLIFEYEKIDHKVILKKWITVTENKHITIEFL